MDRNLGASRVAVNSNDASAFGDYYQWGRFGDGHQCLNSATTVIIATTSVPNSGNPWDGKFILAPSSPNNWLEINDNNLWAGVDGTKGVNNPCPIGYRVPTQVEWGAERQSWAQGNSSGAYGSPLKLTTAGLRSAGNGGYGYGQNAYYWMNSPNHMYYGFGGSNGVPSFRAYGFSVRCIKDPQ